jgi:hypothetical protein
MILVACAYVFVLYANLGQPSATQVVGHKAAIVDQLSGTSPNPSFNDSATATLVDAGYTVEYYGPAQVTVDFFRSLPSRGYSLVLIRAHSTGVASSGDPVAIFTSEPYSQYKYFLDQIADRVGQGSLNGNKTYFVINSNFVRDEMHGEFSKSVIVMMGCTGLITSEMAKAFIDKGAGVYISWDGSVTMERTDEATVALLRSFAQGRTIRAAVTAAMDKVGPDPVYDSHLGYYPEYQGELVLSLPHNAIGANVQVASEASVAYSPTEAPIPYICRCRVIR